MLLASVLMLVRSSECRYGPTYEWDAETNPLLTDKGAQDAYVSAGTYTYSYIPFLIPSFPPVLEGDQSFDRRLTIAPLSFSLSLLCSLLA